uniref:Variant surface glycoprotein (VSG), putative n=3 Tax=Trypanosoma brucei TaxID=5691 RepID=Q4FKK1_TRYB2|nr:variant surface glycoprotein (VSG), putative [Trypanosoma brucei brucei TREU927]
MFTPTAKILLVCLTHAATTCWGTGPALKKNEYDKICDVAEQLQKIPGKAKHQTTTSLAAISEATKATLKLQLAATAAPNVSGAVVYGVLAAAAANHVESLRQQAVLLTTNAVQAAAHAAAVAGGISEMFDFLGKADKGGSATAWCLGNADGTAAGANTGYSGKCRLSDTTFPSADHSLDEQVIKKSGYPKLTTTDMAAGGGGANKCHITKKGGAPAAATDVFQESAAKKILFDLIAITPNNNGASVQLQAHNSLGDNWEGDSASAMGQLLKSVGKLETANLETKGADTDAIIKSITTHTDTLAAITKQVKYFNLKFPDKTEEQTAAEMLQFYTTAAGDKGNNLLVRLNNLKVPKQTDSGVSDVLITALTTTDELIASLQLAKTQAAITAAQAKRDLANAAKNNKKGATNPEEVCNAIEEQEQCDTTPGCHYNKTKEGKKCTLNKEAKQALEKANQETGGKDKKTDSKCAGKEQKDCKSPDCKWEGETCKDSSFLLNKQFALMVSAAFVTLLFKIYPSFSC